MASPILEQYRQKVPAAQGLSDEALAEELRSKFYPEADPDQFKANVGVGRDINQRKIDRYRAKEPKAWGMNDEELITKLHADFGADRPLEEYAQEFGVAVGGDVGVEPAMTGPGPATGDSVRSQPASDYDEPRSINQIADMVSPSINMDGLPSDEPATPRGEQDAARVESTQPQADSGASGRDRRDRRAGVDQPAIDTPRETRRERRAQRAVEDMGPVGRDFNLVRQQGMSGTESLVGSESPSLIGEPMRADQTAYEARQTVYQNQGRGERSVDDLRRGVNRAQTAVKAFSLVDSVSALADARRRSESRSSAAVDARQRLTGADPENPADSAEAIERRLVSAEERDREIIDRETARAEAIAQDLSELQAEREEIGENVTLQRALESGDVDTFLGELSESPLDVMSGLILESLPAMAPALGAGVVGGYAGGPVGAAAGMGTVSAVTEGIYSIQEKLQEYGADLSDPESVSQVWEENGDDILKDSATRGAIIGAFDAAAGGFSARPFAAARRAANVPQAAQSTAGRLARSAADGATRVSVQGLSGAGGEAGAQLATEGRISNPAAVLAEGVAELGFSVAEVPALAAASARRRLSGPQDAQQLRTRMKREGFTENDDGTLQRGDITVQFDGEQATATVSGAFEPRPGTQDDEPTRDEQAADVLGAPGEPAATPQDELDNIVDTFAPSVDESIDQVNQQIQQRAEQLRNEGATEDQVEIDPTITELNQQAQALADVRRQTETAQAERQATSTIDQNRAPTGDALGDQIEQTRDEARQGMREEIQRLRQMTTRPAPLTDQATTALQEQDQALREPTASQPDQADQETALPQPEPMLRRNGTPFKTESSARASRQYREATNPQVAPVDGGFGVIDSPEQTAAPSASGQAVTQDDPADLSTVALDNRIASLDRAIASAEPAVRDELLISRDRLQSIRDGRKERVSAQERSRRQLVVDPGQDTLQTAIQKLGGIDTDLESDFAGRLSQERDRTVGLPGLERPGKGRSLDDLAESLTELGYLESRSVPELYEKLDRVEQGIGVYSVAAENNVLEQQMRDIPEFSRDAESFEARRVNDSLDEVDEVAALAAEYAETDSNAGARLDEDLYPENANTSDRALTEAIEVASQIDEDAVESIITQADREGQSNETIRTRIDTEVIQPAQSRAGDLRDGEASSRERREAQAQEEPLLTQPTPEDLQARDQAQADAQAAQADAERRADADAMRDDFTLTGSDTEADQAAARGQDTLFSLADSDEVAFGGPETPLTPLPENATTIRVDGVERSAVNNNGRPIHWSQEGTRNFWRWFGDSRAVDSEGRPKVLYHGTSQDIASFDSEMRGASTRAESARNGFYFTSSPDVAEGFSNLARRRVADSEDRAPSIIPVYLRMADVIETQGQDVSIQETVSDAVEQGRDGVILNDIDDTARNPRVTIDGVARGEVDPEGMFLGEDLPAWQAGEGITREQIQESLDGQVEFVQTEIRGLEEDLSDTDTPGTRRVLEDEISEYNAQLQVFQDLAEAWRDDPSRVSIDNGVSDVFVVFEPEQVKSAIGNRGTFDATDERINFSRGNQGAGIGTREAAQRAADLMQGWKIAPEVRVSKDESGLPQAVRRKIDDRGAEGRVRGVFHQGKVYVVADNLQSLEQMEETILHEVLGHFGVRNVLGKDMNKILDDAYLTIGRSGLQDIATEYSLDLDKRDQRREAVEEYLARMAESSPDARILDRVIAKIAEWARSMGFNIQMSNAELRELLIRAKRFSRDGEIVSGLTIKDAISGGVSMQANTSAPEGEVSPEVQSDDVNDQSFEDSSETRFAFAGRNSETADVNKLEMAERLRARNMPNASVYRETGWFEGSDGMMRYEINDSESALLKSEPGYYFLSRVLEHEDLYDAYPDIKVGLFVHIRPLGRLNGRYNPSEDLIELNENLSRDQMRSTLLHEVQHAIQRREGFAVGGAASEESYRAIADNIRTIVEMSNNALLGWEYFNPSARNDAEQAAYNSQMGLRYQSAQRLREYARREKPSGVTRLIRRNLQWLYEGDLNNDPRSERIQRAFYDLPARGAKRNERMRDLANDAADVIEGSIPDELLSQFKSDSRKLENMVKALERDVREKTEVVAEADQLSRQVDQAQRLRREVVNRTPYEVYLALAGEVEARNVQRRRDMTLDESEATPPSETIDIADDKVIVVLGGREMRLPRSMAAEDGDAENARFSLRQVREAVSSKAKNAAANRSGMPVKHRNEAATGTTAYVARDRKGEWVTVKTSNPALREQNALKAWLKKKFTKEGQLTDRAYELHTQMLGQRNADEIDISGFTADFLRSVSRSYGRSYMRLSDFEKEALNEYLAGQDTQDIPDAVKAELDVMRGMLDNMSTRTQMMLLDEVRYALQDMGGDQAAAVAELIRRAKNGDDEAVTEIREVSPHGNLIARKMRTFLAIEANKGGYLHRSYRAFDDPSWKNSVPDDVMRRAKDYLRGQVQRDPTMQGLDASGVEDRVDGIVNTILNSESSDMVDFLSQSQLGEKDLTVLKQRENIPEPIRELMGEYKDPRVNFSRTMSHMSTLLASHHFLRSVREEGLGEYLSAEASGRMSQQITAFSEEKMLPLAGLYATPEFRQALIDFADGNNLEGWLKDVVRVTSSVKYGKTVLSPTTMFRNFYSAMMFTVMNGHFGYSNMLNAAQTTWADIRGNTRARRDYMRRLAQLGVIHDSARAGEITAALDDIMDLDTTRGSAPVRAGKEALNIATRMYQAGDDFWKIVGYETEVKDLVNSGMDRADAEVMAAKRVRDGYPTYSMVPEAIQRLRRFPLVGTFVSFPWEVMRTSFNQLRMVREDFDAGRNAKAARRLTGMAIAYSSAYAVKTATMAMFGIDDDEDEAVRKLAAPWQMNSQFAYLGHDDEGRMRYLDLSHLDPYNHLKRPITALTNGNYDNVGEAAVEGVKEFLAPYLGTDITAGVIGEIWANKKQSSGTEVYDENADRLTQGMQAGDHLLSTLRPGILLNVERTIKAFNNQMTTYGREYTLGDEAMAWVGFRLTTSDPKISMQFKSYDFSRQRNGASGPTYDALRQPNIINEREVREGVQSTYSRWEDAFEEMHAVVRAGRVAGLSNQEIAESLDKGGVAKRDIGFIIREQIPPWSPTNQSLENAVNSVLQFNDTPEMRENLRERFRAMRREVIEQRRKLLQEQASE